MPDRGTSGRGTSVRALLELVRAPSALSVPGDTVTGAVAAGTPGWNTALLALSSACLYWSGMAANDWADRAIDGRERPERPIPSGRVAPGTALGIAVGLSLAGVGLSAVAGGRRASAVATALTCSVWAYDLRLSRTLAGPTGMAICRGLDVLLGARGRIDHRTLSAALTVAGHTGTVTVLSHGEVAGTRPVVPAATLATTVAVAAVPRGRLGRILAMLYLAAYGTAQVRAMTDPSGASVRSAVVDGITGLPLLQGALVAGHGAPKAGALISLAAPAGWLLARRVSPT
jgi:hypothetical protein